MDNVNLNTFPSTKTEALTMLYLQAQDLTNVTPEELVAMYRETLKRVRNEFTKKAI